MCVFCVFVVVVVVVVPLLKFSSVNSYAVLLLNELSYLKTLLSGVKRNWRE